MKTLKKLIMVAVVAVTFVCPSFALTEKVGDYTWTYMVSSWTNAEGTVQSYAVLGDEANACVSPAPVGSLTLPKKLGGNVVAEIAANAFKGCASLTDVLIGENIDWIDEAAFNGVSALKRISVATYNECYFSVDGVLYEGEWGDATLIRVPEAYETELFGGLNRPNVYYVCPDAFRDCAKIKKIAVDGNSMCALEEATFEGCSSFEAFVWEYGNDGDYGNYPYVRDGVLYDFDSGELLRWPTAKPFTGIPVGVYGVRDLAFAGNLTVTNLTLRNNATSPCEDSWSVEVAPLAFKGCANLKMITYETWADPYMLWGLSDPENESVVNIEKVVYPWQPAIAEEWEGYEYTDSTGGVVRVDGWIADFKADFPDAKVVFEKAKDPNLGLSNMTFPYTTGYVDVDLYDFEAYAATLTTLTFEGPAADGLYDILDICTNVTKIVYSANPIYRDYDGDYWSSWTNTIEWLTQNYTNRVFTFEQGAVPTEPQFYGGCDELSAFVAYDEASGDEIVFPCVWPAPTGELVIPNDIYCISGPAFKGLTGITSLTLPSSIDFDEEAIDSLATCTKLAAININRPKSYYYDDCYWGFYSMDGILYDEDGNIARVPPAWAGTNFVLRSLAWENALAGCRNIETLTAYDPDALLELNLKGCSKLAAFESVPSSIFGDYCYDYWEWYRVVDGALYEVCDEDYGTLALVLWPPAKKPIKLEPNTIEVYSDAFRDVVNPKSVTEFEIPVLDYGCGEIENCYVDLWELAEEYGFTGLTKLIYHGWPDNIDSGILEILPNLKEVVYPSHPRFAEDMAYVISDFKEAESSVTFTAQTPSETEYVYELDVWDENDYGNILDGECWLGDGELPYAWPLLNGVYEIPSKIENCRVVGAYRNAFTNMAELVELTFPASFGELEAGTESRVAGYAVDTNGVTNANVSITFNLKSGWADVRMAGSSVWMHGGIGMTFRQLPEENDDIVIEGTVTDGLCAFCDDNGGELQVRVSADGKMTGSLAFPSGKEYEIAGDQPWIHESYSPFAGCTKLSKLTFKGGCPEGLSEVLSQMSSIKDVFYPSVPWYADGWTEFIGEFRREHPDADVTFTQTPYDEADGQYWYVDDGALYCHETWTDDGCEAHILPGVWPEPSGEVIVPADVFEIGDDAFYGCSNVTAIVMPEGMEYISAGTYQPSYWDETNATWVAYGDPVPYSPFLECPKLTRLTFSGICPDGLAEALELAPSIREVVYPAEPWLAEVWAEFITDFSTNHVGAVTFTMAGLPEETTFRYELEVNEEDDDGNILDGECWLGDGEYPYAWPALTGAYAVPEKIGNCRVVGAYANAFADMAELTELIFPASFYGLDASRSPRPKDPKPYTGQVFGDEPSSANEESDVIYSPFAGCTNLERLTFTGCCPDGLAEALELTPSIKEVAYPGAPWMQDWKEFIADFSSNHVGAVTFVPMESSETLWNVEDGCLYGEVWDEEDAGGNTVRRGIPGAWPVPASGELVVPDGVVEIGEGAFFGCAGVTRLVLPSSLQSIDEAAFADLPDLQEIAVASPAAAGDGAMGGYCIASYYYADENGLLYSCEGELVCCPAGKTGTVTVSAYCWYVSETAFAGCTNVTEILLPAIVEEVGAEAFAPCTALEAVTVGNSTQIGDAFSPDQRITLTVRPEKWWICDGDHDDCPFGAEECDDACGCAGEWLYDGFVDESLCCADAEWLVALKVEEGVWGIEADSFYGCPNLALAELPESLLWMGPDAFASCASLAAVYYNGDAPYGCEWLYEDSYSNLVSYVKADTTGWNGYEGEAGLPTPALWPVYGWDADNDVPADDAAREVRYGIAPVGFYVDGALLDTVAVAVGTAPEALPAEKTGHSFSGWYSDADMTVAADFSVVMRNFGDSAAFYGSFTPNRYTLTFDADGGSEVADIAQDYGTAVTAPAAPVKVGYTFAGWTPAVPATMPAGDMAFKAQWTVNRYTLTFDADGGSEVSDIAQDYGTVVTAPAAPVKVGFTFAGWTPAVPATMSAGDMAFKAQWTANRYTVSFDANGGSGAMAAQTFTYGETKPLAECAFTRSAHEFVGWATEEDSETIAFVDGELAANLTAEAGGNVTLYAIWERASLWAPVVKTADGTSGGGSGSGAGSDVGDDVFDGKNAEVYDGYIYDVNGTLVGTIQAKTAKAKVDRKSNATVSKVSATIQLAAEGKLTVKGEMDVDTGRLEVADKKGRMLKVAFGANGLSGTYGAFFVDGAQNKFSSKDASDKAEGARALADWQGAYSVAWLDADGWSGLSLTVAAKGKVKVAGTLSNGVKVSANTQLLVGEDGVCAIPVVVTKKAQLAFNVWLTDEGVEVVGIEGALAERLGSLKGGAALVLGKEALCALIGDGTYAEYLPCGISVAQQGTKWVVAGGAKAGKVQLGKDGKVDAGKAGTNPSALKLTYKAKDGTFKGSFKAYASVNGKPKATTVNVVGIVVGDKGYGFATIKKKGSVPVAIE